MPLNPAGGVWLPERFLGGDSVDQRHHANLRAIEAWAQGVTRNGHLVYNVNVYGGVIQAAINAASAAGGGIVFVPEGTHLIATALSIPSFVTLVGAGRETTTLKVAGSTQINCVVLATNGSEQGLRDLTIDCNKANQTDSGTDGNQCGVYGSANTRPVIENVTVKNSIREGFYLSNGGWGNFDKLHAEACNRSGFEVDALQYADIVGFKALNCTLAGLRIVGAEGLAGAVGPVTVLGGMAYGCSPGLETRYARQASITGFKARHDGTSGGHDGIRIWDSDLVSLIGCVAVFNPRHGIYILDSTNCQIIGNTVRNNNKGGTQGADGIRIAGAAGTGGPGNSTGNAIKGNRCLDDQGTKTQLYGIAEFNSGAIPTDNQIEGNDVRGNGQAAGIIVLGAGTKVRNNPGFLSNDEHDILSEYSEITDPAAPAANKARLFSRDNGAGKTQLCVRFPTGAIQVISTEP